MHQSYQLSRSKQTCISQYIISLGCSKNTSTSKQCEKLFLDFLDESVSKNEGYQIETDQCKLHVNCHLAVLLVWVTWLVTVTDVDGF